MSAHSYAFSHVGTTVTDLARAIEWYQDVLGMYLLRGPLEVREDGTPLADAAAQIYGVGFQRFQFAHLCGADGAGVELFQFDNPPSTRRDDSFEYWRTGINHFAVTARDVDSLADRIEGNGGLRRSPTVVIDAEKGYAIAYCEDPWGAVIEVCSHPYTQMWA